MAKRRGGGGGGGGIGLIITLIFFILTTVTLGVTTYIPYSEIGQYEKMSKDAEGKLSAAEKEDFKKRNQTTPYLTGVDKVKEAERERDWYKFQALVVRQYAGYPFEGDDATRTALANDVEEFKRTGTVERKFGKTPPGQEDFKALVAKLDARNELGKKMEWKAPKANEQGGELSPPNTFESLIKDLNAEIKVAKEAADLAQTQQKKAEADVIDKERQLAREKENFKKDLDDANAKAKASIAEHEATRVAANKLALKATKEKEDSEKARADAELARNDLAEKIKLKEGELQAATKDKNVSEAKVASLRDELGEMRKRLKEDEKTSLDRTLDAEALKVLHNWPQDKLRWKIVQLDQKGTHPYINLGAGDGLEAGMTFSVHSMGRDGKLSPVPKGTIEVRQLISNSPHLARVAVTSVTDAKNDPIVAGDHLFNPTWSPGAPKRVAIAGLADLGGEGTDSSADLRRLLKRQGVAIDAYVSTKDDKAPEVLNEKGDKGEVTAKTAYLIVADGLEVIPRHPKKKDADYNAKFNALVSDMTEKARANGVAVISLQRYLDMIGYKPPKVITSR